MSLHPDGPSPDGPDEAGRAPREAEREWVRAAVRRYERPLVAYAAHLTGSLDQARDVVQETFVRLCSADRPDVETRLAAWLFAVTRNGAIDLRRKQRRMRLVEDDEPFATLVAGQASPELAAERGDSLSAIHDAISTLPPVQQEAVRLKFQHGLSYKEIGAVLNLTATNVGFILHTALKAVRARLDDGSEARLRA
jgi:RNA polymerase sigma-70 factor (ECF subfamily)